MKKILTIIILTFAVAWMPSQAQSLVQQADSAYNNQDFVTAVRLYNRAIADDGVSAEVYYNLGNAYYRIGKLGRAVISYERALKLDPSMADARANLAFVNTKILDKPEDDSSFLGNLHQSILSTLSPDVWAWLAFGLFVAVLGCIALYIFSSNILVRKTGFFGGGILLLLFIYALAVAKQSSGAYFSHDTAVVIVPTTNMSTSPGATATKNDKVIPVHEGTVVEVIDSMAIPGETSSPLWYDVKINNATRAWVRAADVERI